VRPARARVMGRFDSASALQQATVTIQRVNGAGGLFSVRVFHKRRQYELPLGVVAEMVCQRIIKGEVFQARLAKRRGRR
jgi:hypothetical protein